MRKLRPKPEAREIATARVRAIAQQIREDVGNDECWEWPRSRKPFGYGAIGSMGWSFNAHALSYESFVGDVPTGLELDHLCRNPPCINPTHLEPVTHGENIRRGKGDQCKRGHPRTAENRLARGVCKQCREQKRREYAAKRALVGP